MALTFPITTKCFLCSNSTEIYSLNNENGGFVTTISDSSSNSKHSLLRKSPSPSSSERLFSPDLKSSATSNISMPPSPVLSYTFVTTALYGLFSLLSSVPITSNKESLVFAIGEEA